MPRRSVHQAVEINAPIERVWEVLADFPRYGEWNPFVVGVEGDAYVGSHITLNVVFPSGRKARAKEVVTEWQPPTSGRAAFTYRYNGRGRLLSMIKANRSQTLVELSPGKCRYETTESFSGWLSMAVPLADVRAGIEAHAAALKSRAEAERGS
ncbi:MAG: SRPBCC domain-containing protein [Proteobacteria bacterium]|nr:SRPBCC domain-containing protein [Pseudomonadota bacterium]